MSLFTRSALGSLALVAVPLALAQTRSGCDAGLPHLQHSAPWVGATLELALDGAPPGADVRLFHSPQAARANTPFGLLELERTQLGLVAGGQADAVGHWSTQLAIPLDASLVEVEDHYQALVLGPATAPTLSDALHLRYLGPRCYTWCSGGMGGTSSSNTRRVVDVHAVVGGEKIAAIGLGFGQSSDPCPGKAYDWQPAFSANLARGAVLASCTEVLVFDNFSFQVLERLPVETASEHLLTSADGRRAFVLEERGPGSPARIRALDLESASFVATLDLPATCKAYWCLDEASQQAYVSDEDPLTGRTLARRVDLAGWQVLDTLPLGEADSAKFEWLQCEGGWLYASTSSSLSYFTAIDLSNPDGESHVASVSYAYLGLLVVSAPSNRLFLGFNTKIGPGPGGVFVAPLDQPDRLARVHSAPSGPFTFGPSVVRDDHLWVFAPAWDQDYYAQLWNLDAQTLTWWSPEQHWLYPWPKTLLASRGPLADVLLLPRTGSLTAQHTFEPRILTADPITGELTGSWELDWGVLAGYILEPH